MIQEITDRGLPRQVRAYQGGFVLLLFMMALDEGNFMRLPWWALIIFYAFLVGTGQAPVRALWARPLRIAAGLALGFLAYKIHNGATWLGEQPHEGLEQAWRWFFLHLSIGVWFEALTAEPDRMPDWLASLFSLSR